MSFLGMKWWNPNALPVSFMLKSHTCHTTVPVSSGSEVWTCPEERWGLMSAAQGTHWPFPGLVLGLQDVMDGKAFDAALNSMHEL